MKFPIKFYDIIRESLKLSDIVQRSVKLIKKGQEYVGLCPFHFEKTPSFTVNNIKKFYHCFGCHDHGDVIKFIARKYAISYVNASIELAKEFNIKIPTFDKNMELKYKEIDLLYEILSIATSFFKSQLNLDILSYLESRNISQDMIKNFDIGFAPRGKNLIKFFESKSVHIKYLIKSGLIVEKSDGTVYEVFQNRIIFPIKNIYNKIIAFGGRVTDNSIPKYLNSPETLIFQKKQVLYGLSNALSYIYKSHYSIVVEGYVDVISLHNINIKEAVAILGTAVTDKHLYRLWNIAPEIIFCLDGDIAGKKSIQRVIKLVLPLIQHNRLVTFIQLPNGHDPANVIELYGKDFFYDILAKRINLSELIWKLEFDNENSHIPEIQAKLEYRLRDYLDNIKDTFFKNYYTKFFRKMLFNNVNTILYKNDKNKKKYKIPDILFKDYIDIDFIEYSMFKVILMFPKILNNTDVNTDLTNLNFVNVYLNNFRDWLIRIVLENHNINSIELKNLIEKSSFSDVLMLVFEGPGSILLSDKLDDMSYTRFWDCLYKKHYLFRLKSEYSAFIKTGIGITYDKIDFYRQEILNVSKQIEDLNESFS